MDGWKTDPLLLGFSTVTFQGRSVKLQEGTLPETHNFAPKNTPRKTNMEPESDGF